MTGGSPTQAKRKTADRTERKSNRDRAFVSWDVYQPVTRRGTSGTRPRCVLACTWVALKPHPCAVPQNPERRYPVPDRAAGWSAATRGRGRAQWTQQPARRFSAPIPGHRFACNHNLLFGAVPLDPSFTSWLCASAVAVFGSTRRVRGAPPTSAPRIASLRALRAKDVTSD